MAVASVVAVTLAIVIVVSVPNVARLVVVGMTDVISAEDEMADDSVAVVATAEVEMTDLLDVQSSATIVSIEAFRAVQNAVVAHVHLIVVRDRQIAVQSGRRATALDVLILTRWKKC